MDPLRPVPRPTVPERALALIDWVRLPRLAAMAVSVLIVAGGSWWLLRSPAPPVEQSLPYAAAPASSAAPSNTAAKRSAGGAAASTSPNGGGSSTALTSTSGVEAQQPAATAMPTIVVQAAGAVVAPGVFTLPRGARVNDLIAAAGGPSAEADAQSVNLAAVLVDGERLYLPKVGEAATTAPSTSTAGPVPSAGPPGGTSAAVAGPIDINHADAATIDRLPGIGPSTALAIVAYRDANGPYSSPDDLLRVRGIGPAKLAAIRSMVAT